MILTIFLFSTFAAVLKATTIEDCKKIGMTLPGIVEKIDVKDRFFRSPEEYKDYADKCEEIMNCAKAAGGPEILEKLLKKISPCLFYIYYNRDFSSCAHKLIVKKDSGVACLNTLFNDIHEPDVDACKQWDGLQPCVKEQIAKICDEKTMKEYVEQEKNLRKDFCY